MRLGIDVGGTHTDAVLIRGREVVASHKAVTTADISEGIIRAARSVIDSRAIDPRSIELIMLGTTQFTNAVIQRRELATVAALRIGAQSTSALPPFIDWPAELVGALGAHTYLIDGGHEYDGSPIVPLDRRALSRAIDDIGKKGVAGIGVTSVFSPLEHAAEYEIADEIGRALPGTDIALSHQIGRIGLYQRENATLLNAALMAFAKRIIGAFEAAFSDLGLQAPLFISQNDGTLMNADFARRFPVLTFSSGPTNSMRGAAFLTGMTDAMVIDVGGTTSDIGMLMDGFPRLSGSAVEIGGVLTNFRMPDILAVGLGGGSVVRDDGRAVGPDSVGHELISKSLCFGGAVITATDIAVAAGRAAIGTDAIQGRLSSGLVDTAREAIRAMIADNIDRMKTSSQDLPLIVVGGGGFLVPDDLPGISEVVRPAHAGVANAIGAALAQIGGEAEVVYTRGERNRADALAEARSLAIDNAVAAGADRDATAIVEINDIPMSYLARPAARLHVKAVGDLASSSPWRATGELS